MQGIAHSLGTPPYFNLMPVPMRRFQFLIPLLLSSFFIACNSKEKETVLPSNILLSDQGLIIELDWNTGSSSNQALHDTDLDLYLDHNDQNVESSERIGEFEEVYLRDVYRDGSYDIYIGALDVSRRTDYSLYISAPGGDIIHHYRGYFEAGETGDVHYLRIQKEGRRYTLVDL